MAEPGHLARVMVELADTLIEEFDMLDHLGVVAERCVELLPVDAAGVLLADQRGELQLLASTHEAARLLLLSELSHDAGPSVHAGKSGRPVVNVEPDDSRARWPAYRVDAERAGFGSTHAFPMQLRGRLLGALVVFTHKFRVLDDEAIMIGQALADVATIGLLHERTLFDQQLLGQQLLAALHSRVLVEQAKGMLAARAGITVSEAFSRMRAHARTQQLTMTSVATAVVSGSLDARSLTGH